MPEEFGSIIRSYLYVTRLSTIALQNKPLYPFLSKLLTADHIISANRATEAFSTRNHDAIHNKIHSHHEKAYST